MSTPRSDEFNETFDETHRVYMQYQMAIHNDPPEKPSKKQFKRFLVDSSLQVVKLFFFFWAYFVLFLDQADPDDSCFSGKQAIGCGVLQSLQEVSDDNT